MAPAKNILKAWLIVGTLDITAAFIQVGIQLGKPSIPLVLNYIGTAVLGKNTGLPEPVMMAVGLLVHYLIAGAFTLFYFFVVAKLSFAKKHRLITGILYGAFIWAVMNVLVLPITKTRPFVFDLSKNALAMGILIVCIGIPLAFLAHPKYRQPG